MQGILSQQYASNIVHNANTLATLLYKKGVKVQMPHLQFTASHQLWIDCGDKNDVDEVLELLSELNIAVNGTLIPSMDMQWGIRIGVQEITKQQVTSEGIEIIAELISYIIKERNVTEGILKKREYLVQCGFNNRPNNTKLKGIIDIIRQ